MNERSSRTPQERRETEINQTWHSSHKCQTWWNYLCQGRSCSFAWDLNGKSGTFTPSNRNGRKKSFQFWLMRLNSACFMGLLPAATNGGHYDFFLVSLVSSVTLSLQGRQSNCLVLMVFRLSVNWRHLIATATNCLIKNDACMVFTAITNKTA